MQDKRQQGHGQAAPDQANGANRADHDEPANTPEEMTGEVTSPLEDIAALLAGRSRPWVVQECLPDAQLHQPGYTRLQVQLLHNRGRAISTFTTPDSADGQRDSWRASGPLLADLPKAVEHIHAAIASGDQITIFGDYDCDGITSCALLTSALQTLGAQVNGYVPTREDDGRGLNAEAVQQLAAQGTRLLITTDCGTANVEEVQLARSLGIGTIITDHHPLHGPAADALALLNPHHPDNPNAYTDIAGVGVAFRLAEALAAAELDGQPDSDARRAALREQLPALLDLVAVGTIADVAPLTLENWKLAHAGIARLNTRPRPGLAALARRASLTAGQITERDISFSLAPRLNAAGRLGKPELAMRLLLTTDRQEANGLAAELDELNNNRQRLTDEVLLAARQQLGDARQQRDTVLVARGNDWHLGILGLVAGRLCDEYQRPAFVISSNEATAESRGSARGRNGVNLGETLANWGKFKRFGGHAQAAGFTIASDDLEAFIAYLRKEFPSVLADGDATLEAAIAGAATGEPVQVDCELPLSSLDERSYRDIRKLAPFGPVGGEFAEPVFLTKNVRVLRCWQSGVEKRNLRLTLGDDKRRRGVNFLWQRQGDLCAPIQAALPDLPPVEVVYTLDGFQRRDGFWELMPRILALKLAP